MSATLNQLKLDATISKLHAFCSTHSLFKSDEKLRDSFENFFVSNYPFLENEAREKHLYDFETIKEILAVLYELSRNIQGEFEQTDASNHLYASLKRHPE